MEDNSPDPKVREIIDSYDDPRIKKFFSNVKEEDRYKTARYATLINDAFRLSHGEIIAYLTDDDFYFPHRLQDIVDGFKFKSIDVIYTPQLIVDTESRGSDIRGLRGVLKTGFNVLDHNQVAHRREVFVKAGGWYDVAGVWGGADAYFWRRIEEAGYKFYPVGHNNKPDHAKRYHTDSVQWKISNNCFYPK